ncbi:response regulator [bacterium]|nr:response regulator [bacterium]
MLDIILQSHIFIVDDEPHNLALLGKLLGRHGFVRVSTCQRPEEVIARLKEDPPDLLLLDLSMPGLSGLELLELLQGEIRNAPPLPVLVLTGDTRTDSRRTALALGARDFVSKPFDPPEVICRIRNLLESRCLERKYFEQSQRLRELHAYRSDCLRRLSLVAELRDDPSGTHALRVGEYCRQLAQATGLDEETQDRLELAAQLHDVGKLAVPEAILLKAGPLTVEERELMKQHVLAGRDILQGGTCPVLELAQQIALYHHERWDGRGYLGGLAGAEIPLCARLVSICEVFDALTSHRPYRRALPVEAALEQMRAGRGSQFDPELLDLFLNTRSQEGALFHGQCTGSRP